MSLCTKLSCSKGVSIRHTNVHMQKLAGVLGCDGLQHEK